MRKVVEVRDEDVGDEAPVDVEFFFLTLPSHYLSIRHTFEDPICQGWHGNEPGGGELASLNRLRHPPIGLQSEV